MKLFYNTGKLTQKRQFILACATLLATNELHIMHYNKNVIFVTYTESCIDDKTVYGATSCIDDNIYVYINPKLGLAKLLLTIAHEMIHVAQFCRGHLKKVFEHGIPVNFWCGKKIENIDYFSLPWEVKAYNVQEKYAIKLASLL